ARARQIQVSILGYFIGYVLVYQKGYQEHDTVLSAASAKVKGIGYTCPDQPDPFHCDPSLPLRVWDTGAAPLRRACALVRSLLRLTGARARAGDYVIPPQEEDAFFVATSALITLR